MPATADQIRLARSWMGNTETDAVFNERYDRLGTLFGLDERTLDRAIEESMRAQLAALTLDQPTSVTVGDLSMSWGQAIIALTGMLKDFLASGGTMNDAIFGGTNISRLFRSDVR